MATSELTRVRPPLENERAQAVLDAAEELFALHGYDGVTMRQIATLARVDVALPNYYFQSKRGLLDAVFERRAALFNQARSEALDVVATAAAGSPPPLEDVIAAFLKPIVEAQTGSERGWRNYCRLVAQINNSPVWVQMMTSHFDPIVKKFMGMIQAALPEADQAELYVGYHCLSGSITLTMADTGRLQDLSGGLRRSNDFALLYARMVDLYAAGFRQLASPSLGEKA